MTRQSLETWSGLLCSAKVRSSLLERPSMTASHVSADHVRNPRRMLAKYVWADLVRNPRRTLSTAIGVMLGVGFSCAILFFVDGLSASMTQRAVAPLAIDMQLVSNEQLAGNTRLGMAVDPVGPAEPGDVIHVRLEFENDGETSANEVIV